MSNEKKEAVRQTQSAASAAGFHFYQLYQCCPRKFYLKYVVGLDTKWTAPALIYGAAFHEAKAEFYRTGSLEDGLKAGTEYIEANVSGYESHEQFEKDLYRLPIVYRKWVVKFGMSDLLKYDVVSVEREMRVTLPNGFVYTGRPDTILRDKVSKKLFIMETKTSGFSKDLTLDTVFYGDQVTSYLALVQMGKCSDGGEIGISADEAANAAVICDVAYWNKNAKYEDNIDCLRGEPITRSKEEIEDFLAGIEQLFSEVSQKVEAAKKGNPFPLFQRNTYYCLSYGKPCEFVDICRLRVMPSDKAPLGFVKKDEARELSGTLTDQLAES